MVLYELKRKFKSNFNKKKSEYYATNYESTQIDEYLIVYESRDGKSIVDSPYAIFLSLINDERFSNYKHVWIINPSVPSIKESIPQHLRDKVQFIERTSLEYVKTLLTAKYLINNSTFESFFVKKKEQVYINTWHGTPLKHMGFDIPGNPNHSQNVLRNFLMTDYIISPNTYTSEIFIKSYKLGGIYPGTILEGGYPRIDFTFDSDKADVINRIEKYGASLTGKKVILFCPTWKGTSVNNATDDIDQIVTETLYLAQQFEHQYDVLVKVHPYVASKVVEDGRLKNHLVSDLIDANEVLSITDILVTDYSSIFFDFLVTNKPIVFYVWDKDLYQENRGMYLNEEDLPGPTAETLGDLVDILKNVYEYHKKYEVSYTTLAQKIVSYNDDGQVTKRYIERIFNNHKSAKIKELALENDKKKIIIYPGAMVNNGITSSALNLINNIDYSLYDVTVILNSRNRLECLQNIDLVNKKARLMFRFGWPILTPKEKKIDKELNSLGLRRSNYAYPKEAYQREMSRLTANLSFDVSIDFSGYSYYWARHMLSVNAKKYIAFMHNDLVADSNKVINGVKPRYNDLNALFSIYFMFDKLLSVSPMTRDVNLEKMGDYVTKSQMSYVYNTININQVLGKEVPNTNDRDESFVIKTKQMKVLKDATVNTFKDLTDIEKNLYVELPIKTIDKITKHASYLFGEKTYMKTSVNDTYVGWINEQYFTEKEFEILSIEPYHTISTASYPLKQPIWNQIRQNDVTDEIITYIGYFKNRYIETDQVAKTSGGRYVRIKYNGKVIGWMSPRALKRTHKVSNISPLRLYFNGKIKKKEAALPIGYTTKIEKVTLYGRLKTIESMDIYNQPKGTTNCEIISTSDNYKDEIFLIDIKAWMDEDCYYSISLTSKEKIGYILSDAIELISEDEYKLFKEKENQENKKFNLPKVDLSYQKVPEFDDSYYNVVNMGRLSPEKNQTHLIQAFAKFNKEVPKSRLFILGKGPLETDLVETIKSEKMQGKVFLLGHIKNPFNFIKKTDLFILPSYYEGQPMVLLESMVLGLKILGSNIPANINVIGKDEEYGLLTNGTDTKDIYDGLNRIYNYKGEFKSFDYVKYNEDAIQRFYQEIDPCN